MENATAKAYFPLLLIAWLNIVFFIDSSSLTALSLKILRETKYKIIQIYRESR